MITTTLNRIWACDPCEEGKARALAAANKAKPDDEPITFAAIVDAVGLDDALWCCRAEPQHEREWRLYAVWCARQVQHLMADQRCTNALDVAERYANGNAGDDELAAAWDAAWAAARDAAGAAASAAAWAAASAAARDAAGAAARDAAWDAAWAAARDAAWAAASAAAWAAQQAAFVQLVTTGTLP
jgi:hypothetical protein